MYNLLNFAHYYYIKSLAPLQIGAKAVYITYNTYITYTFFAKTWEGLSRLGLRAFFKIFRSSLFRG